MALVTAISNAGMTIMMDGNSGMTGVGEGVIAGDALAVGEGVGVTIGATVGVGTGVGVVAVGNGVGVALDKRE